MRAPAITIKKISLATAALLFVTSVFYGVPAHSANPACTPTTSTVGNLTVLEFVNPNTNDSNTTGSDLGYTCDWTVPANVYSVTVVIVGGGGSGGFGNQGGGGGGGEVLYTTNGIFSTPGATRTITVGAGGAASTAPANTPGQSGASSSYAGITAHGGGAGGSGGPYSSQSVNSGTTGGSSGGGSRFGNLVVAPTKTSATGFTSLANAGGKGAGKSTNDPASATQCAPFGAGGGGGGAMSVGGDAIASCSDSSTAGSVNISVGAGGAGAYLLGKCVGGGGASLAGTGTPTNAGTITVNEAAKTPCKDPNNNNQDVAGTFSGGGSGTNSASGTPNTGGGASGAPTEYNRPRGGSGVVLVAYDPSNPPVAPNIRTQPQSKSILSMGTETLTVAANINDGGTLSYKWQSAGIGTNSFMDIMNSDSSTLVTWALPASSNGVQFRVRITNTKGGQSTTTTSNVATITVNRRTTTLSLSYPESSTARYFSGETLTAVYSTNSDNLAALTFTGSNTSTVCTVNRTSGLITALRPGQCIVQIFVPQSDRYTTASLTVTVTIRPPIQIVSWSSLPALAISSPAVQLGTTPGYNLATGETATGAGTIIYSVSSCSSFSITANGFITPIAIGSCSIRALQQATASFDAGSTFETLTVVATPPNAPFINSASSSGGATATSGAITVSLTSSNENGASITQYVVTATPSIGPAIQETLTAGAGNRTVTVTGLTLGTSYSVKAFAINSAGRSAERTYTTNLTPAGIPYGVSALSATPGDTTLTINYTGPASLNGGTWDKYQYFISPTGRPFSDTPTATSTNQATTSYTFTGLVNGAAYDIKVVALTSANGSASSVNTTLLNLIPAVAPQALTISVSRLTATTARVNWYSTSDGGSPITAYAITVTKNGVAQSCYTNLATTTCTLSGLNAMDLITAAATSTNLIGTSPASTTISYTHSAAPLSPTGITATPGDTTISIAFTQPQSGDSISDYEYSFDRTTFVSFGTNVSPVVLTGLTNEVEYTFFIRAIGTSYGAGVISETITVIAGIPAPPPPSNGGGGGGGYSYSSPIVVVETTTVVVVETPTVIIIIETSTGLSETVTPVVILPKIETTTVITKISIRMQEPFRINSYFINVAATKELQAIIKKYRENKILKVITIGYSSPSLVNPYPSRLGTWRAEAIAKTMKRLGLKTSYTATYGGLYKGSRKDARKVRIVLYIEKVEIRSN